METKKRIIDHTGIKVHTLTWHEYGADQISFATYTDEFIKVSDFENLIRTLGKPDVLQKVIKSVMFGSSDNFDLASLLSAPDQSKK